MSQISFEQLPDKARLWIFPADRPLSPEERAGLTAAVTESLAAWNAHGSPVRWGQTLVKDQVLLIGVDETHTELSGCSIDSCIDRIRQLERDLDTGFLDHGRVFYREGERLTFVSRPAFRALAEAGAVGPDTVVYDNVLQTVGEYRHGRWEVPARDSWHARAFPLRA
jgi:hypothetical protein